MKSLPSRIYKLTGVASFLVLVGLQFFLIYNFYQLTDEHFFFEEKKIIHDDYSKVMINDVIYPGASAIMDSFFEPRLEEMKELHARYPKAFRAYAAELCDSFFHALILKNNVDSLLDDMNKKHRFKNTIDYALTIDQLDVLFAGSDYIPMYSNQPYGDAFDSKRQMAAGYRIGGTLEDANQQNRTISYGVSIPFGAYFIRISFNLHTDIRHRTMSVLQEMMPTFILSFLSTGCLVILFFATYRNWMKQKKIADMHSDFVNSITHEFHTPLSAIIVANRSLQNKKIIEDKEKIYPLTQVIKRQSERLQSLIEKVLNVTTMNHLQLSRQPHSLHRLLDDILLDYRLKFSGTDIRFSLYKEAQRDEVFVDIFWLTTLLTNLFDNGVKYNSSEQKTIAVSTQNKDDSIVLSVKDNGIGMKKKTLKHSFDKFYRDDGELKNSDGLGLGLYYVKCCIVAHNWSMDVETELGEGTCFYLFIPLKPVGA